MKKNITRCYLIGKNINFFKKQIKDKIDFRITKNLSNSVNKIFKDIKLHKQNDKTILLSPAAASFDQYKNFEKEVMNLKLYVGNIPENFFKYQLTNYWRCIDKKILLCFFILFFLGLFFPFLLPHLLREKG